MVNYLSDSKLLEDWRFGKESYSRANPPPTVSCLFFISLDCLLSCRVCFVRPHQSALVRIPSSIHQPAPRGRPASSLPIGRRATSTTPIWGRRLWKTTPREEAARGSGPVQRTGLMMMRRSPPATGQELAIPARALLPRRVLRRREEAQGCADLVRQSAEEAQEFGCGDQAGRGGREGHPLP